MEKSATRRANVKTTMKCVTREQDTVNLDVLMDGLVQLVMRASCFIFYIITYEAQMKVSRQGLCNFTYYYTLFLSFRCFHCLGCIMCVDFI